MLILPYNLKCYVKFKYPENKDLSLVLAMYLSDPKQLLVELYMFTVTEIKEFISSYLLILRFY